VRLKRSRGISIVLLLVLSGCVSMLKAGQWRAIEGRVLEVGTDKPVPGAIVIARWRGYIPVMPADSTTVCYHVESAVTDGSGWFHIPGWREGEGYGRIEGKKVFVNVYKARYQESRWKLDYDLSKKGVDLRYLKPYEGSLEDRIKYLDRIEYDTRCPGANVSGRNMLRLYRALYAEASHIAVTKEDKKVLDGFRSNIEVIELGYDTALQRAIERARKRERRP